MLARHYVCLPLQKFHVDLALDVEERTRKGAERVGAHGVGAPFNERSDAPDEHCIREEGAWGYE